MKLLLFGYGSIGKRHASILRKIGHEVVTVDPSPKAGADYAYVSPLESVVEPAFYLHKHRSDHGIRKKVSDFLGVLDCTHHDQRPGWRIPAFARFVEKPLGTLTEERARARTKNDSIMVGFCYRWMRSLEEFVKELSVCRVYSLTMVAGQHLQDWHEGDYRLRYHGTPGIGGVINDSLSHSLYIARWILGELEVIGAVYGRYSNLDISTEDTCAVLLKATDTGIPCTILVDYLRKSSDHIEAVTSRGVKRFVEGAPLDVERMYRRQMEVFCEVCMAERVYGYPDLNDGLTVRRLMEEVRRVGKNG